MMLELTLDRVSDGIALFRYHGECMDQESFGRVEVNVENGNVAVAEVPNDDYGSHYAAHAWSCLMRRIGNGDDVLVPRFVEAWG